MKSRIQKFLEIENINPSKFADEIGVQRSSISHILSGRNNPSLELIQKILTRFDYINAEWLITGKGEMFKPNREPSLFDALYTQNKTNEDIIENKTFEKSEHKIEFQSKETLTDDIQIPKSLDNKIAIRKVKQIILLYDDGKAEIFST
ncbi:MAG: helix-turn-helix transcriptional regulator [Bacteroidales bacterium]|nr:helix-turn-helix transcriptional regulator [Bacteroidales bacterium]